MSQVGPGQRSVREIGRSRATALAIAVLAALMLAAVAVASAQTTAKAPGFNKAGDILISDQYNNRVSAYDRNGNRKWIIPTGNPANSKAVKSSTVATESQLPANMQIPAGMTIDGADRLVIADPFGFDLVILSAKDGRFVASYGAPGTVDGQFVYPSSVSYDPTHDWFAVADTQNGRVQIIRLPDSGGSGLAGANRILTGPLRACIIPLLLIILAIVAGIIYRVMKRRKSRRLAPVAEHAAEEPDDAS